MVMFFSLALGKKRDMNGAFFYFIFLYWPDPWTGYRLFFWSSTNRLVYHKTLVSIIIITLFFVLVWSTCFRHIFITTTTPTSCAQVVSSSTALKTELTFVFYLLVSCCKLCWRSQKRSHNCLSISHPTPVWPGVTLFTFNYDNCI